MTEPDTSPQQAVNLKEYVDQQIDEVRRAVDVAREGVPPHVTIQAYFEMLLDEREKWVQAILEEQRRAMHVAEDEREKAAAALRVELGRAIAEGDHALRDHIAAQVAQMQAALTAADQLERERFDHLKDRVEAERRVAGLTRELSDTAILKAESSADKRFDDLEKQIAALREELQGLTRGAG